MNFIKHLDVILTVRFEWILIQFHMYYCKKKIEMKKKKIIWKENIGKTLKEDRIISHFHFLVWCIC